MFCLWLENKKANNLQQLKESFDFDIVEMYLLGGSLKSWLIQCGEEELAKRVNSIDLTRNIHEQLSEIFKIKLPKNENKKEEIVSPAQSDKKDNFSDNSINPSSFEPDKNVNASLPDFFNTSNTSPDYENEAKKSSFYSETGSFEITLPSSFETSSNSLGSFTETVLNINSFEQTTVGSFEYSTENSSFNQSLSSFEYSFESSSFNQSISSFEQRSLSALTTGSFTNSSFNFNVNSFGEHEFEFEFENKYSGSFAGSFAEFSSSFPWEEINGSFVLGSFTPSKKVIDKTDLADISSYNETYELKDKKDENKEKEKIFLPKKSDGIPPEEKIKQNITSCPLNRYGYGIHLI